MSMFQRIKRYFRRHRRFSCVIVVFILTVSVFMKLPKCMFHSFPEDERMPPWVALLQGRASDLVLPETETAIAEPRHLQNMKNLPNAVIFVMTLPQSFKNRDEIRQTWYSWKDLFNIEVIFFSGLTNTSADIASMLQEEMETHDDIIIESHIENYSTLPVKVLLAMKYFLKMFFHKNDLSGGSPFFIKTDDDVFINLPNLAKHLTTIRRRGGREGNYVGGNLFTLASPSRNVSSKFYIPHSVYPACFWPNYVGGSLYIIGGDGVRSIYQESLDTHITVPMEDLFLTGLVANRKCRMELFQVKGIYDTSGRVGRVLKDDPKFNEAISFTPVGIKGNSMSSIFNRVSFIS